MSSRPSNTNSPNYNNSKKPYQHQHQLHHDHNSETINHDQYVFHNTFQTQNYHLIGVNSNSQNGNNVGGGGGGVGVGGGVGGYNGTTTSSGGSGSSTNGYDTLSISTAMTNAHLNDANNSSSSGSGASVSNLHPSRYPSSSYMFNKQDDDYYNELGKDEINILINNELISMDLPPDKLKIVKSLPDDKKKALILSMRNVKEKEPPEYYINMLKTYIEGISNQKTRRPKVPCNEKSTALIKNLEVSLRTNRIDWVHKFLDTPLNGLDVLIQYLENSLNLMREYEQFASLDFIDAHSGSSINSTLQFFHPNISHNSVTSNANINGLASQSHSNLNPKDRKSVV